MKKYSIIFLTLFLVSFSAEAKDGFYVGLDAIRSSAKHKFARVATTPDNALFDDPENPISRKNALGYGVSAGYKLNYQKFFLAPELFFDQLNNNAADFYAKQDPNSEQDSLSLNYRYGFKMNLGYKIVNNFSGFLNYGFANTDYDIRLPTLNVSQGKSKLSQIYGFGFIYDFTDKWSIRTSYDHQAFNIGYVYEGCRSGVKLNTIKLGLVYNF